PAGDAPTLGTSCAVNAPRGPIVTPRLPAATASPSADWNDGHEISTVPDAALPSARYTVPLIVVSANPCACDVVDNVETISTVSATPSTTSAVIEKYFGFTANDLGISCSLLVNARDPILGPIRKPLFRAARLKAFLRAQSEIFVSLSTRDSRNRRTLST